MLRTFTTISLLLLGGCVGSLEPSSPPPPPGGSGAAALFADKVAPLVASCGGGGCHEGTDANIGWSLFLGAPGASDNYTKIVADLNVNGNFNAGNAALITHLIGGHKGLTWSTAQVSVITEWLDAEADARGITGGGPPTGGNLTAIQAMARFSSCMSLDNWTGANMSSWSTRQTNNGVACGGCHNAGAGGFAILPNDPQATFNEARREQYLYAWVIPTADPNKPGSQTVKANTAVFEAYCGPGSTHPDCGYGPNDPYMQRLDDFVARTLLKFNNPADPCQSGGFPP